jgi:hypothetical protein
MRSRPALLAALMVLSLAGPALGQPAPTNRAETWRGPAETPGSSPSANRAKVTSDETATQPTAAEQRKARALAAAIFAKPAAAQRAAENAAPEPEPEWAAQQPRAEWTDKSGVAPGGRGVKATTPF